MIGEFVAGAVVPVVSFGGVPPSVSEGLIGIGSCKIQNQAVCPSQLDTIIRLISKFGFGRLRKKTGKKDVNRIICISGIETAFPRSGRTPGFARDGRPGLCICEGPLATCPELVQVVHDLAQGVTL